jgi:hypothetical protein
MFSLSVSLSILCFTVCLFRWSNMPKLFWPAQIDDLHLISIVDLFSIFDTTIVRFLILPAYMLCCPSMLNLMHSFSIWDIWVTTSIYNEVYSTHHYKDLHDKFHHYRKFAFNVKLRLCINRLNLNFKFNSFWRVFYFDMHFQAEIVISHWSEITISHWSEITDQKLK